MGRNNIRSFRYSNEVADILDGFAGNSMNDKFNNLVHFCFTKIPDMENQVERYSQLIEEKKKEYSNISQKLSELDILISSLKTLQYYGDQAVKRAKSIAEDM